MDVKLVWFQFESNNKPKYFKNDSGWGWVYSNTTFFDWPGIKHILYPLPFKTAEHTNDMNKIK